MVGNLSLSSLKPFAMKKKNDKVTNIVRKFFMSLWYRKPTGYTFILAGHSFFSRSKEGEGLTHRRRIKTEATAKVVASVWGTECIQFLAALAILY